MGHCRIHSKGTILCHCLLAFTRSTSGSSRLLWSPRERFCQFGTLEATGTWLFRSHCHCHWYSKSHCCWWRRARRALISSELMRRASLTFQSIYFSFTFGTHLSISLQWLIRADARISHIPIQSHFMTSPKKVEIGTLHCCRKVWVGC